MKDNSPQVSIIIPMRNAQDFISRTLKAILSETQTSLEVIVVNDCSTNSSLDRVASFKDTRLRVFEGPNRGISACLNEGLGRVRGSIVMRCDADDIYPKHRISEQVRWLDEHPGFDAVCGSFSTIDVKGKQLADMPCGSEPVEVTNELIMGLTRTHLGSYAIRSSLIAKVQGFREYFETAEDIDFQLRLSAHGRIGYVPSIWYLYRIHASSITHMQQTDRRLFFETTAADFQHQRRLTGADNLDRGLAGTPRHSKEPTHFSSKQHIQGVLFGRAWNEHKNGNWLDALVVGVRALKANPASLEAWKSMAALALKPSGR